MRFYAYWLDVLPRNLAILDLPHGKDTKPNWDAIPETPGDWDSFLREHHRQLKHAPARFFERALPAYWASQRSTSLSALRQALWADCERISVDWVWFIYHTGTKAGTLYDAHAPQAHGMISGSFENAGKFSTALKSGGAVHPMSAMDILKAHSGSFRQWFHNLADLNWDD